MKTDLYLFFFFFLPYWYQIFPSVFFSFCGGNLRFCSVCTLWKRKLELGTFMMTDFHLFIAVLTPDISFISIALWWKSDVLYRTLWKRILELRPLMKTNISLSLSFYRGNLNFCICTSWRRKLELRTLVKTDVTFTFIVLWWTSELLHLYIMKAEVVSRGISR